MEVRLRVENLYFAYGALKVLEKISFVAAAGEIVAFVGSSGCGKTTLLRCISGLLSPGSGRVLIQGTNGVHRSSMCSFVFQRPTLLPWLTVEENLALPFRLKGTKIPVGDISEQLNSLGLGRFAKSFPSELSVGMAQRVALARSLLENRSLILLDEPYSGLDELTKRTLSELLCEAVAERGLTALIVTHSVHDAVFLANRIHVLSTRPTKIDTTVKVDIPQPRPCELWLSKKTVPYVEQTRQALEVAGENHEK